VTLAETNNVVRTQTQGAGTYKVIDIYMTMTPGAEYTNHRIAATATTGSLFDPARLQDSRQQDSTNESSTGGSVDTYVNTVITAAGGEYLGLSPNILSAGGYFPTGSGAAPAFTFLDWSVFDTQSGDDNDLSDLPPEVNGPLQVAAPYRIARILASNTGTGTIQVQAFDTLSGGVPSIYNFTYGSVINPDEFGDFNHDGVVDAADYVVWRNTGGSQTAYDHWRANFGTVLPDPGTSIGHSTIPEPSSLFLCLAGIFATRMRRRNADSPRLQSAVWCGNSRCLRAALSDTCAVPIT
jgi:hypothetical protein